MEMGKALNLSHNTMATGSVYFHRFYMFHSFQDFPKLVSLLEKPNNPTPNLTATYSRCFKKDQ